jgi:periplasmic divalent cation tolerance protein
MTDAIVIISAFPDEDGATRCADALVGEGLAACVQVQGPIRSTFRWKGAVDHATEWFCQVKTSRGRYPAVEHRIRALHPYEVPEIIALPVVAGNPAYLRWVGESVADMEGDSPRS